MEHSNISKEDFPGGKFDTENPPEVELETWLGKETPGDEWIIRDDPSGTRLGKTPPRAPESSSHPESSSVSRRGQAGCRRPRGEVPRATNPPTLPAGAQCAKTCCARWPRVLIVAGQACHKASN
jgi:hypothetical protein